MRTVIEVGAHAGIETRHFLVNQDVKVYAFEPNVRRFRDLLHFSQENPRLYVLPFAVSWGDNQEPLFHDQDDKQDALKTQVFGKQFTMTWTMRLDTFIEMYDIPEIDFLRIDAPFSEEASLNSLGDHAVRLKCGRVKVYEYQEDVLRWLSDNKFSVKVDGHEVDFWR